LDLTEAGAGNMDWCKSVKLLSGSMYQSFFERAITLKLIDPEYSTILAFMTLAESCNCIQRKE
jgi:hypothetical protein